MRSCHIVVHGGGCLATHRVICSRPAERAEKFESLIANGCIGGGICQDGTDPMIDKLAHVCLSAALRLVSLARRPGKPGKIIHIAGRGIAQLLDG